MKKIEGFLHEKIYDKGAGGFLQHDIREAPLIE